MTLTSSRFPFARLTGSILAITFLWGLPASAEEEHSESSEAESSATGIVLSELNERRRDRLAHLDTDGDGVISPAEREGAADTRQEERSELTDEKRAELEARRTELKADWDSLSDDEQKERMKEIKKIDAKLSAHQTQKARREERRQSRRE